MQAGNTFELTLTGKAAQLHMRHATVALTDVFPSAKANLPSFVEAMVALKTMTICSGVDTLGFDAVLTEAENKQRFLRHTLCSHFAEGKAAPIENNNCS